VALEVRECIQYERVFKSVCVGYFIFDHNCDVNWASRL